MPFHFRFSTSEEEIRHLVKSWLFISLAFGIVLGGIRNLPTTFFLAALTVGIGFIVHEMGHKVVAQYYGCKAEFRSSGQMLWLALITSLFGIVFAAPGAVLIAGRVKTDQMGRIALAGPVVNYVVALLFFSGLWFVEGFWHDVFMYGFTVNAWLGVFNMIPIWILDGRKVLAWNKLIYGIFLLIGVVIMQLSYFFS